MTWAAGIDIGGTNLKAGLVSDAGNTEEFLHEPVERSVEGEAFARRLAAVVDRLAAKRPLAGIGVGVPATLRAAEGKALPRGCNLPGLNEFRLGDRLRELTNRPVHVANDADMAMAGEARFGAARGVRNAVAVTIGTGIGTGLWLDGKLWEGAHGSGAEFGLAHGPDVPQRKGGPRWVSLEAAVSAGAVRAWAGADAERIFARARAGDRTALDAVATVCEHLGVAVANIHLMLDLELVLLCGGMARAGDVLLEGVRAAFRAHCVDYCQPGLEIRLGALGDEAGVLGAAALAFDRAGVAA